MASVRNVGNVSQLTEFGAIENERGGGILNRIFGRKTG